jgi:hypothetical protein
LELKPKKRYLNLGICTKMAARFCIPFNILDKIGPIAYMIASSSSIKLHYVFHVSILKNYVHDPNHVIDWPLIYVELEETPMWRQCVYLKGNFWCSRIEP